MSWSSDTNDAGRNRATTTGGGWNHGRIVRREGLRDVIHTEIAVEGLPEGTVTLSFD